MDGVSAAASLTALVGFALQSSSFIYQIVNTILDGPNQIKSLASRVNGLHTALIQIAELLHSQPPLGQDQNHPLFKRLRSALQACAEDLQKLQLKLQKLNRSHEKGLRRAWYIVKSVLGAKEFEDADTIIKEHVQNLGLHLEIIGRYDTQSSLDYKTLTTRKHVELEQWRSNQGHQGHSGRHFRQHLHSAVQAQSAEPHTRGTAGKVSGCAKPYPRLARATT